MRRWPNFPFPGAVFLSVLYVFPEGEEPLDRDSIRQWLMQRGISRGDRLCLGAGEFELIYASFSLIDEEEVVDETRPCLTLIRGGKTEKTKRVLLPVKAVPPPPSPRIYDFRRDGHFFKNRQPRFVLLPVGEPVPEWCDQEFSQVCWYQGA